MAKLQNPTRSAKQSSVPAKARAINNDINPTDYIIKNMTPSPLSIADVHLELPPFEAIDLTYDDPMYIRASRDLTAALDLGMVIPISREQYNLWKARKIEKEKESWAKSEREQAVRDKYGRNAPQLLDINSVGGKNKSRVSTTGYANDPRSFLAAYSVAAEAASARGEYLDPEDFAAELAKKDNIITPAMMERSASQQSGRSGNAYVASVDNQGRPSARRVGRASDDISLDLEPDGVDLDLSGVGESIDLELD